MASRGQKRKVAVPSAIPWTLEKAAFALGNVKVTPFDATTGLRCVGKNSLAEAIKGNISRTGTTKEGKVIWINILKRDNCQLPLPDIYSAKLEGSDRAADVFEAQDVPDAIHKLVGVKDATDFFGSALFVAALKQCMERCGLRDLSTLDKVVAEVAARASKTQEQLEIFKIPELLQSEEGSKVFAQMRLYKDDDGLMLISAHNQIKWLGMDDDGKHHEWDNWLRGCVVEYIATCQGHSRSLDLGNEYTPRLKYVKFNGESNPTPMYCVKCFYQVIILSIGKSKLAGDTASKALNLYGRYAVGDQRLLQEIKANFAQAPQEAKDFVIGEKEASRQATEDGDALALAHKARMLELEYDAAQKRMRLEIEKMEHENASIAIDVKVAEQRAQLDHETAQQKARLECEKLKEENEALISRHKVEAQQHHDGLHEEFRRQRASTITANLDALRALRPNQAPLSPRSMRVVEDELRTGLMGKERPDPMLGKPVYCSRFLHEHLLLKESAAKERAKVFGNDVKEAVRAMFPDYDISARTNRSVDGHDREPHLYFEVHLPAFHTALSKYLARSALVKDEELTREGLQKRRAAGAASIRRFFRA